MPELPTLWHMEVHLTPDLEAKLNQLSAETGRAKEELVQDAMAGYLAELSQVRSTLDARYDDIKSGRVKPIDGENAFTRLRQKKTDRRRG
jgi:predicted transcriptional regulator